MSTCTACGGAGGKIEETVEIVGGKTVIRQTWHTCTTCGGR